MTPPLPTRIAVSVVLICVAVLLASACGFGGGGPAPVGPALAREDFVLWQSDPAGGPDRPIGAGFIDGFTSSIFARVQLADPPCPFEKRDYTFTNSSRDRLIKPSAAFTLYATPYVTLTGKAHPSAPNNFGLWRLDFPLLFNFSSPACNPAAPLRAEARTAADLSHRFVGTFPARPLAAPLRITLFQANPAASTPAVLWGELAIPWNPETPQTCGFSGTLAPVLISTESHPAYTFRMSDRSTVVIVGLPATLDPYPSDIATLTLKFQGGPCDGKSWSVDLSQ